MGQPDIYDCAPIFEYDEAALDCMIQAFASRTPGRYDIEGTDPGIPPWSGPNRISIRIREDGRAVRTECQDSHAPGPWDVSLHDLAPAGELQACAQMPAPADRYDCLLASLSEPLEKLPSCG